MFFYINNTKYSFKYVCLIRLANFIDGLVAVLSLGFLGTRFEIEAHKLATYDIIKRLKKERSLASQIGGTKERLEADNV